MTLNFLVLKKCPTCGKETLKRRDRGSYCSPACQYARGLENRKCVVCGEEFRVRRSYKKTTCSKACKAKLNSSIRSADKYVNALKQVGYANRGRKYPHKPPLEKVCEHCKKSYSVPYKQRNSRYCSTKCWYNHLRQNPSDAPQWRGGEYDHNYGRNWDQQRRRARKRDNYTCQRCGIAQWEYGKGLDVHHKVPFRHFGIERYKEANQLKNLITLCRSCHVTIENQTP